MNSNLSRLTLVLITYERQKYALRNISYWSNLGVTLKVLDGSKIPIEDSILRSFSENIFYKHDPTVAPEGRIYNILSEIDTEYVALIGDDEFYVSSTVSSCIKELDEDSSLTTCCGCGIGFDPNKETGDIYSWKWGDILVDYNEVMDENPIVRLQNHMRNYEPTLIYGITRVQSWKIAFSVIASKKFNFFTAFEIQYEMLLSFAGKGKVIKELMWLRSAENNPFYNDFKYKDIEPEMEIQEWWCSNSNRAAFIKVMSDAYEVINPALDLDYSNAVELGCNSHIEFREIFPLRRKAAKIRSFIRGYTPRVFIAYRREKRRKLSLSFSDGLIALSDKNVKIDFICVKKIEKIIHNFHNTKYHK